MIAAALAIFGRVPVWAWLVAGAIAVASAWIWVERSDAQQWRQKAEGLQVALDTAEAVNKSNLDELARIRADHAGALRDLTADLERARKAGTRLTIVKQEIARDPDAAAPLADRCGPLDRFLDRMLDPGAARGDEDRARPDPAPGGAPGVRS